MGFSSQSVCLGDKESQPIPWCCHYRAEQGVNWLGQKSDDHHYMFDCQVSCPRQSQTTLCESMSDYSYLDYKEHYNNLVKGKDHFHECIYPYDTTIYRTDLDITGFIE